MTAGRGALAALVLAWAAAGADAAGPNPAGAGGAGSGHANPQGADAAPARQQSFLALLRSHAERRPEDSLALAERLVEAGPFAERDRAEYWIGSVRLSLGDRDGARTWFSRLARDHPGSPWAERGGLGLADAAAQERRYGDALALYGRAAGARDAGVRERSRLRRGQVLLLRSQQRWAWAAAAFACAVALSLLASILRGRPRLRPLPAELRIAGPVLLVLALLSLRQEPAPRAAVLETAAAGAVLAALSGLRLRALAAAPGGRGLAAGPGARGLHAALTVAALLACAYAVADRNDLVGTVLETLRAGSE